MSKIITITNHKGGVGKTTTAQHLTAGLQSRGHKVLAIDLDPQGNLSHCYKINAEKPTIFDVLLNNINIQNVIQHQPAGHIVPANISLSAASDLLVARVNKEKILHKALRPIKDNYDYIIIDTPPALNILTLNALVASHSVIVPTHADTYSLQGIDNLSQVIADLRDEELNTTLHIEGILITHHNERIIVNKQLSEALDDLAAELHTKVYKSIIRITSAIREAQVLQTNLYKHSPKSNAAADYMAFIDEFLEGGNHVS